MTEVANIEKLNLGKLVDMKWQVGVSVSSNSCKNLQTPFVRLTLHIADSNERIVPHSFQLSLAEFELFASYFDNIAAAF
jgi:COMM domain containing 6